MSQAPSGIPARIGGPYQPVTIYDAPEVLFTQAFNGVISPGSVGRTIFQPDSLSPVERENIADRLANAAGGSNIARAISRVALNPWTWFLFASAPIGEKPIGALFEAGLAPWVEKNSPLLAAMGFLSTSHAIGGTRTEAAVNQWSRAYNEFTTLPEHRTLLEATQDVFRKNGIAEHGLNWRAYTDGSPQQITSKELWAALFADLKGYGKDIQRTTQASDAENILKSVVTDIPQQVLQDPQSVLRKYGAESLTGLHRDFFQQAASKLFSDPDAVLRIYRGLQRGTPDGTSMGDLVGRELAKSLLGDAAENVAKGNLSVDEFKGLIQQHVLDPIRQDGNYFPDNVSAAFIGANPAPKSLFNDARWASAIRATPSATPRGPIPALYHPDDLEAIRDVLGSTPALDAQIAQGRNILADSAEKERAVRFFRVDPVRQVHNYTDSGARTYGLFQVPGEGVLDIDRQMVGQLKSQFTGLGDDLNSHAPSITGERAPITKTIGEVIGTSAEPAGGFSLADTLYADYANLPSAWRRDSISKVVIPRLLGRISLNSTVKAAALNDAKGLAEAFLETPVAGSIEGSGKFGKRFIDSLRNISQSTETSFEEGEGLQRFLLKTLYSAHLGLNLPSALINITQPFLFAGAIGGYGNVVKAYGAAFKEYGNYIGERASQGFRPLTEYENASLIAKHFKFADYKGEGNVLEYGGSTFQSLEHTTAGAYGDTVTLKNRLSKIVFDYPLFAFTQAELINRNVAAHVAEFAQDARVAQGAVISDAAKVGEIRRFVRETQFGGHWLNQPQLFLPEAGALNLPTGRLLANPLIRQFLSYPLRSFTTAAYVLPRLGGRTGLEGLGGALHDIARGIGASAIGYEVGRSLLNVDLSRAGFASALTDIIPGFSQGRFDFRDGPLPIPPVLDIPYNIAKGLASDDYALIQRNLPRLIPGGVAISRALSAAPSIGPLSFLGQKQYAGWGQLNSDGQVPIYRADGSFQSYQNPSSVILRSLGVSINSQDDESKWTGYLVKQRDEISNARREYMVRLAGGDSAGAEALAKDFEARFRVPLTVTKGQLAAFLKGRNTPRLTTVLNNFPEAVRTQYQNLVGGSAFSPGGGPQQPVGPSGVPLTPDRVFAGDQARGVVSQPPDIQRSLTESLNPAL